MHETAKQLAAHGLIPVASAMRASSIYAQESRYVSVVEWGDGDISATYSDRNVDSECVVQWVRGLDASELADRIRHFHATGRVTGELGAPLQDGES